MSRWTIANRLSDGSGVYFRLTVHRVDHLLIIGLDCYRGTALNNYLNLVGGINFYRSMEKLIGAADVVVSMGGYNTVCEILSQSKPSLIIPREQPRREQLIRAQVLCAHKLADFIPWHLVNPNLLREKLLAMLQSPEPYQEAIREFRFTGLEVMQHRLAEFRGEVIREKKLLRI